MPTYKVVNADKLDADLQSIADAIKAKLGWSSSEKLGFPNGFISAINTIGNMMNFIVYSGGRLIKYEAERGMTWLDYCSSKYHDEAFACEGDDTVMYYGDPLFTEDGKQVAPNDEITDVGQYSV